MHHGQAIPTLLYAGPSLKDLERFNASLCLPRSTILFAKVGGKGFIDLVDARSAPFDANSAFAKAEAFPVKKPQPIPQRGAV
jgi:hypothetical protein